MERLDLLGTALPLEAGGLLGRALIPGTLDLTCKVLLLPLEVGLLVGDALGGEGLLGVLLPPAPEGRLGVECLELVA